MEQQENLFAVASRLDHVSLSISKERLLPGEPIHLMATGSAHKRMGTSWCVEVAYHTEADATWIPYHLSEILQPGWTTYGLKAPRLTSLAVLADRGPAWGRF